MSTITIPEIETIASKLAAIPDYLEKEVGLIGRRTESQILMVCIGAKLHPLYYGPPGVAKSMTVDAIRRHFPEMSQFKTQAYKASPPEQFLGQVSIKGMADDQFYRLIEGKLPSVQLGVIDEISRAPRSILPAFQGMMVEREFDSGSGVQPVPLGALIGTVNSVPDDTELDAFFDRFTFKVIVQGPQSQTEFLAIMESALRRQEHGVPDVPDHLLIPQAELVAFQEYVRTVKIDRSIMLKFAELWANITALDIIPSPRRWQDLLLGMKTYAAIDGREECVLDDMQLAQHSLWKRPEDAPAVYAAVIQYASGWVKKEAELMSAFQDTLDRLGQVQDLVAKGASFDTKTRLDGEDPDAPEKSLMDHGIKLVGEHRELRALIDQHIAEATGQDVSNLEAVKVQMDAAKDWIQDKLTMGLQI